MVRIISHLFFIIELVVISLLVLRCDSTTNPPGDSQVKGVKSTLNSFIQDTGFSCLDNFGISNTQSLTQLCVNLLLETKNGNAAVAPMPILSVLASLSENSLDTVITRLRSKIPCTFFNVDSDIRRNSSWYKGINMESIFWGQSGYLFSTNFLNTISLCNGTKLKIVDFAKSSDNFQYLLSGYMHSLPDCFDSLSFSCSGKIDSIRGLFTSAFYINTLFDSSVIGDTICKGIFWDDSGKKVVTNGIKFKKGLKAYQDSSSVVYSIALNDTSLFMYICIGNNESFKLRLEKILEKQIYLQSDTVNQLWLPYFSIKHEGDFYKYFPLPINDTMINYSYINKCGALKLTSATSSIFFSLSSNLTVAANAAVWLKATPKENKNNWEAYGIRGENEKYPLSCGNDIIQGSAFSDTISECRPFAIALIHKKTNSVISIASVKNVPGIPLNK